MQGWGLVCVWVRLASSTNARKRFVECLSSSIWWLIGLLQSNQSFQRILFADSKQWVRWSDPLRLATVPTFYESCLPHAWYSLSTESIVTILSIPMYINATQKFFHVLLDADLVHLIIQFRSVLLFRSLPGCLTIPFLPLIRICTKGWRNLLHLYRWRSL